MRVLIQVYWARRKLFRRLKKGQNYGSVVIVKRGLPSNLLFNKKTRRVVLKFNMAQSTTVFRT